VAKEELTYQLLNAFLVVVAAVDLMVTGGVLFSSTLNGVVGDVRAQVPV